MNYFKQLQYGILTLAFVFIALLASISATAQCSLATKNPSFETPVITNSPMQWNDEWSCRYLHQTNQNALPPAEIVNGSLFTYPLVSYTATDIGWQTSASSGFIEFRRQGSKEAPAPADGNQYVELNSDENSSIYQNFTTTPGSVFTISFMHRGRNPSTSDECQLQAGDATWNNTSSYPPLLLTKVKTGTTSNTAISDNAEWYEYRATYTVPAGQTNTRFRFVATKSGSGQLMEGNFLDKIEITGSSPDPIVTTPITYCAGETATQLTATKDPSGTLYWLDSSKNPIPAPTPSTVNITNSPISTAYYVYQEVQAGCPSNQIPIIVIVLSAPSASIAVDVTSINLGGTSPIVTLTGLTGTPGFTFEYTINSGATQTATCFSPATTVQIPVSTSTAGSFIYALTKVTDNSSKSCSSIATGSVTINVSNPSPNATISGTTTVCSTTGATRPITFTASNGTGPYEFAYTITTASGVSPINTASGTLSQTINQSITSAGDFTYTLLSVKDIGTGVTTTLTGQTATVKVNPIPVAPTLTVVDNCDGTSDLTATGYTGSLNWSTTETTPNIIVSTANTYTATQTINSCVSLPASVVAAPKSTPIAPTYTVVNNCDGTSDLTATGFTGSLNWSTTETTTNIKVSAANTYTVTQTINGCVSLPASVVAAPKSTPLAPTYTVVNNCDGTSDLTATGFTGSLNWSTTETTTNIKVSAANTYTVTQTINGCVSLPTSIVAAPKSTPIAPTYTVVNNCDGTSDLTATGFTGSLNWSTSETTPNIKVSAANTYTVTQTINGCVSLPTSIVAAPKSTPIAPTYTVVNNCDGTSDLTATGYTGSLNWSTSETTPNIKVSAANTYTVTQTINGCVSLPASVVAAPRSTPLAPTYTVVNNCDGTSDLTATGFTGSLNWSTTETTPNIKVSAANTYTVTQTINGCVSPTASVVAAPRSTPLAPTYTVVNNCNGTSDLTATGFTGSLNWSTSETTPNIKVSTANTYTVTQTINGCVSLPASIVAAPRSTPLAPTYTVVNNCDGTSDLTATGFTGSLNWSTSETTPNIKVSAANTYTVSQTINGCVSPTASIKAVPNSYPATPTASVTHQPNCKLPSGIVVITAPLGGNMVYSKDGINYQPTTIFNNLTPSSTYDFYTKNSVTGCISQLPNTLTINAVTPAPPAPTVVSDSRCGNGVVNLSATGSDVIKWYADALLTNHLKDGLDYSASIANTTNYYVTTVENSTGCESTGTMVTGTVRAIPDAPLAPTQVLYCINDLPLELMAQGNNLLWYTSSTGASSLTPITPSTSSVGIDSYYVTQTIDNCESPKTTINVQTNDLPEIKMLRDSLFIYPNRIEAIEAKSLSNLPFSFEWFPAIGLSSGNILNPSINAKENPNLKQDYELVVTSNYGCKSKYNLYVEVLQPITPPNVFSPNNDGVNDTWVIENIEQYPEAHVSVFNRYGQFVYDKIGYNNDWDGTFNGSPLNIDTYFWIIKLHLDGPAMQGSISIIR